MTKEPNDEAEHSHGKRDGNGTRHRTRLEGREAREAPERDARRDRLEAGGRSHIGRTATAN